MQVIFENKNERINSRRIDTVGFDIYTNWKIYLCVKYE